MCAIEVRLNYLIHDSIIIDVSHPFEFSKDTFFRRAFEAFFTHFKQISITEYHELHSYHDVLVAVVVTALL